MRAAQANTSRVSPTFRGENRGDFGFGEFGTSLKVEPVEHAPDAHPPLVAATSSVSLFVYQLDAPLWGAPNWLLNFRFEYTPDPRRGEPQTVWDCALPARAGAPLPSAVLVAQDSGARAPLLPPLASAACEERALPAAARPAQAAATRSIPTYEPS